MTSFQSWVRVSLMDKKIKIKNIGSITSMGGDTRNADYFNIFTKEALFDYDISKKIYVRMLQNKYISCLLTFSKKSITEGIAEINLKYRKTITFTDKLICIIYKK